MNTQELIDDLKRIQLLHGVLPVGFIIMSKYALKSVNVEITQSADVVEKFVSLRYGDSAVPAQFFRIDDREPKPFRS